jgi:hypothetical protein
MLPVLVCILALQLTALTKVAPAASDPNQPYVPTAIATTVMVAQDTIPKPPQLRHSQSPDGHFHLVLTAVPESGARSVTAALYENQAERCQQVWRQIIPQEYGPRYALVTDNGQTLFLDEWINVASSYAIVVVDRAGSTVAQYGFDDIVMITGTTRADIVAQAQQGFWLGGEPTLLGHDQVAVPTAGGRLTIDLDTGELAF